MNIRKLKEAEALFLSQYPDGFDDEGMARIRNSHNIDRLSSFARDSLARANFARPDAMSESLLKIVSRSSMVSRFEKPPFRDFIESLNTDDKARLAAAFEKRLYGRQRARGFEEICDMLARFKLAKWSLVSAVPFYLSPASEAFVKPTTAKRIVAYLEADLTYRPAPDWAFYQGYRDLLSEVKANVTPTLAPNNAALSGFLMMTATGSR